jgi:putative tributyrin esterase
MAGALGTLRATLFAAAVAIPPALAPVTPLAAQTAPLPATPASLVFSPENPLFDAARRAYLTKSALFFVPGEHESAEEDGVYVLPAPVPWPPGAGARERALTVPAGKPLFLLAGLAPGTPGFNGPPAVFLDGVSLGNVLPHAVRGVQVSNGTHQEEHTAVALVLAPPQPGKHTIEITCGVCASAHGPWLGLMNGGRRRYDVTVEEPAPTFVEGMHISTGEMRSFSSGDPLPVGPTAPPVAPPAPPVPAAGSTLERRVYSQSLGRQLPYRVYLPAGYDQTGPPETLRRYPVLYLLHGLGAGVEQWSRLGLEAELDRQSTQAIVVAPAGRGGYWVNHADGGPRWADYVLNDVIGHVDATYRTLPQARSRAIGGISMGGHGALQLALSNPAIFGAVGAHSPALRTRDSAPNFLGGILMAPSPGAIPPQAYAARDPISLAARPVAGATPALWIDTGEGDPWRARAEDLRVALGVGGWRAAWSVQPGGHEGPYWSRRLPEYVRFYREQLGA